MAGDHIHILLVEDDEIDAEAIMRGFYAQRIANPFTLVSDGIEALDALRGKNGRPRLPRPYMILLDINMPKVNGLEVLDRLKHHPVYRRIPVVVLTSSREDRDLAAAYDLGVNSYIEKPVSFNKFMEVADQIELYWCVTNQRGLT